MESSKRSAGCGRRPSGRLSRPGAPWAADRPPARASESSAEDVAVAVVALELHQVHRLPPARYIVVQIESDQTGFPGSLVAYALS